MPHFTLPAQGLDVPAWFGKLPGMGDFAQRRLAPAFLELWDTWLQTGLQQLRAEREDWVAHYLEAPLWFFALGPHIASPNPWIGVLMPSVDSVGRYFPLTLAIELVPSDEATTEDALASMHRWWERSAKAALTALDSNLDASRFDASLFALFGAPIDDDHAAVDEHPTLSISHLPADRMSCWFVNLGTPEGIVHTIPQLPTVAGFEVLFGYANLTVAQR
jgi:type VI secretion system protein ImpM